VDKFAVWHESNPTHNWRAALETFARGEHFNEKQHELAKVNHREADVAAARALLPTAEEGGEARMAATARSLRAAGADDGAIAAHLRREGDPGANIASVRKLLDGDAP
jgi:hypothetical protein